MKDLYPETAGDAVTEPSADVSGLRKENASPESVRENVSDSDTFFSAGDADTAYMAALPALLAEARREKASIMTAKDYLVPLITAYIPVVGVIVALLGRKKENPNRRNFFKVSLWTNLAVTLACLVIGGVSLYRMTTIPPDDGTEIVSESDTISASNESEDKNVSDSDTKKDPEPDTDQEPSSDDVADKAEEESSKEESRESKSSGEKSSADESAESKDEKTDVKYTKKENADEAKDEKSSDKEKTDASAEKTEAKSVSPAQQETAPKAEKYTFNAESGAFAVRINGTLVSLPISAEALAGWDHVDTSEDESDASQEIAFYYDKDRSSVSLVLDRETKAVKMLQLFFAGAGTEVAGLTNASTPQDAIDTFASSATVDTAHLEEDQQNGSIAFHFGDTHAITILYSNGVAMMITVQ